MPIADCLPARRAQAGGVRTEKRHRRRELVAAGLRRVQTSRRSLSVLSLLPLLLVIWSIAFAADDPVTRAMKLYEKRHYTEAANLLSAELNNINASRQGPARLALGMAYLRNAELHRELFQTSVTATLDYRKRLAAAKGRDRGRFVDLYYGEALIQVGKADAAVAPLERFLAAPGIESKYQAIAQIVLGLGRRQKDGGLSADALWKNIPDTDPEVRAELAAAYSKAGFKDRNPAGMMDAVLASSKKGTSPAMRTLQNALSVYAATGNFQKGLALLDQADLKEFSHREAVSRSKVIAFYDLGLLNSMASIYLQAAIASLEQATGDAKVRDTANFYLAEAYDLGGNMDHASRAGAQFLASAMPQELKDRLAARQAVHQYRKGRQFEAIGVWDELSRKQPLDPDALFEVLVACGRLRIDCAKPAQRAVAAAESGDSRKVRGLHIGLGRYYFAKKDYVKAKFHFEAGRDKSNKNKIEQNDPVMLVQLAEAYYQTKQYSEALEIYFEMSKQYPEVRQIQEAMGGIYSMEHKSAGDVKIN